MCLSSRPDIPLSGGLVTVSNSLTKAEILLLPALGRPGRYRSITHPPLFPAANRLPTCRSNALPRSLQGPRHSHENPQSRLPGRRPRHPRPARHQGDAEGNADHRRQAADPVCGRRGQGGRHRAFHLRHRPQQGRDRGSFRPDVRTRRHARRARQEGRDGDSGARPARSRRHEFHPAAGAARPRPRGVVRPRHRRQRAVRGGAAGRTGAEHAGLPRADDRGRQASSATNPT